MGRRTIYTVVNALKDADTAAQTGDTAAKAPEVNYTDALLKGLSLTLPDVEKSVESGTFKNLSPEAPKPVVEPAPEPELFRNRNLSRSRNLSLSLSRTGAGSQVHRRPGGYSQRNRQRRHL